MARCHRREDAKGEKEGEEKEEVETNTCPSLPSKHLIRSVAFGGALSSGLHPTNSDPLTTPVLGTAAFFETMIQDSDI